MFTGLASKGEVEATIGDPSPGAGVSSTFRAGPQAQAGEKLVPQGPGVPRLPARLMQASRGSVDTWAGGQEGKRSCASVAGREERRVDKQRRQI